MTQTAWGRVLDTRHSGWEGRKDALPQRGGQRGLDSVSLVPGWGMAVRTTNGSPLASPAIRGPVLGIPGASTAGTRFALVGGGSPVHKLSGYQASAPGARKHRLLYKGVDTTFLQRVRARSGPISPELQGWGWEGLSPGGADHARLAFVSPALGESPSPRRPGPGPGLTWPVNNSQIRVGAGRGGGDAHRTKGCFCT